MAAKKKNAKRKSAAQKPSSPKKTSRETPPEVLAYKWYGKIEDFSTAAWWHDQANSDLLSRKETVIWERLRRIPGLAELAEEHTKLQQTRPSEPRQGSMLPRALVALSDSLRDGVPRLPKDVCDRLGIPQLLQRLEDEMGSIKDQIESEGGEVLDQFSQTDPDWPYFAFRDRITDEADDALIVIKQHFKLTYPSLVSQHPEQERRWSATFHALLDLVTTGGRYSPVHRDLACVDLLQAPSVYDHEFGEVFAEFRSRPFRKRRTKKDCEGLKSRQEAQRQEDAVTDENILPSGDPPPPQFRLPCIAQEDHGAGEVFIGTGAAKSTLGRLHYTPLLLAVDLRQGQEAIRECFEKILQIKKENDDSAGGSLMKAPSENSYNPIEKLDQWVTGESDTSPPARLVQAFERSACLSLDELNQLVKQFLPSSAS